MTRPTHLKLVHPAPEPNEEPERLAQAAMDDLLAAMERVTAEVERLTRGTQLMIAFVHWRLATVRRISDDMTRPPDPPRAA